MHLWETVEKPGSFFKVHELSFQADDSSLTPSGTLKHAATSAATPSTPKAVPVASSAAGGGGGGGFMSEMSKLLAKRKQIAEVRIKLTL